LFDLQKNNSRAIISRGWHVYVGSTGLTFPKGWLFVPVDGEWTSLSKGILYHFSLR
jgi:hypothetical protein